MKRLRRSGESGNVVPGIGNRVMLRFIDSNILHQDRREEEQLGLGQRFSQTDSFPETERHEPILPDYSSGFGIDKSFRSKGFRFIPVRRIHVEPVNVVVHQCSLKNKEVPRYTYWRSSLADKKQITDLIIMFNVVLSLHRANFSVTSTDFELNVLQRHFKKRKQFRM